MQKVKLENPDFSLIERAAADQILEVQGRYLVTGPGSQVLTFSIVYMPMALSTLPNLPLSLLSILILIVSMGSSQLSRGHICQRRDFGSAPFKVSMVAQISVAHSKG